jgi:hypothetical protein
MTSKDPDQLAHPCSCRKNLMNLKVNDVDPDQLAPMFWLDLDLHFTDVLA